MFVRSVAERRFATARRARFRWGRLIRPEQDDDRESSKRRRVAGLRPRQCGRPAWIPRVRPPNRARHHRRCWSAARRDREKCGEDHNGQKEIGRRPGEHDQETLPHGPQLKRAVAKLRRDMSSSAGLLAGLMSPTNLT